MSKLVKISEGIHYAAANNSVLEITRGKVEPDSTPSAGTSSQKWASWGTDNDYPQRLVDLVSKDPTSMGNMDFKIKAHYGAGPYLYKEVADGNKVRIEPLLREHYPEIDDFFWEIDVENFMQGIITDCEWWNRCNVEYITNGARNKLALVARQKTLDVRKAKLDTKTGALPGYYLSGAWPHPKESERVLIPSFNRRDPYRYVKSIYEHNIPSVDKIYYNSPSWHSKMAWLEVATRIPKWILSNIDNAANIKYHIEIPEKYFIDLYPRDRYNTDEEMWKAREDAEEELKSNIIDALTGVENVSKTFFTKFALDENGNPMPGWKITELSNPLNDEAWLKADQIAASRIVTADGVPASLSSVVIANTSGGSASDVREQFNYYMQLKSVMPRQTTLEWFYMLKRINKWPREVKIGHKQIILQTLDENKSGTTKTAEETPTTDKKD
ncbi:hypothetical protein GBO34_00795 [Roseivirga pacifica]|uniref:hypothetical protein n=1 Tax=Roseivirga pacifica TaxID=1267423 RepID=UPI002095D324|nr:hypothetical protein [Roseivirga pacifica]MCO6367850.1 hypothetical protein [Roseivirga pacifica]MCO6377222.1 hypothetical protein [Roseivirga pacifica]